METRRVGSDTVEIHDDSLVVRSAYDMPLWKPTKHRRVVIVFDDERYTVKSRSRAIDERWEYELEPYPDVLHELPSATITYDAAFVLERDDVAAEASRRERTAGLLFFVLPLLGFLPAKMKSDFCARYGVNPRMVTVQSLWIENILLLVCGGGILLGLTGLLDKFPSAVAAILFVLIVPDTLIRKSDVELETESHFGFYEWLVRGRVTQTLSKPKSERPRLKDDNDE